MNERSEVKSFREAKISDIPKNEIEEEIRSNLIERERGIDKDADSYKILLGKSYEKIINILKDYVELKEEYYNIIALWIIGTYMFRQFPAYPYLFINAMRGSGKSRTLKLIAAMSWNGDLITSIREAVLFRSAGNNTLAIDEFEGVMKKENDGLREILNASYKKGVKIKRMKRKKTLDGDDYVVEEFEPYTPIVMANIWGMEEVLSDRAITLILEKTTNSVVAKKAEDFEDNILIKSVKNDLNILKSKDLVYKCSFFGENNIYNSWNQYINMKYSNTYTYSTYTTQTTLTTPKEEENVVVKINRETFFNKIDETDINGRNLELFLPFFMISKIINDDVFNQTLEFARNLTKQRKLDEMTESRDVLLLNFISRQEQNNFHKVTNLTNLFRHFVNDDENDFKWVNSQWLGRALKRLNLIVDKRRLSDGMEVMLDINKAADKLKIFK